MPRIGDKGAPVGELVRELAGGKISGDVTGANYVVSRMMQIPLGSGGSSELSFAVQNPESVPLAIKSGFFEIRTAGQSSASMDIGIVASSSKTASDVGDSADIANAGIIPITIGTTASRWEKNGNSSDAWLTGKIIIDGASSLTGYLFLEVVPVYST